MLWYQEVYKKKKKKHSSFCICNANTRYDSGIFYIFKIPAIVTDSKTNMTENME